MSTLVSVLLTDVIPFRERTLWQGYMRLVISVGTGVGAPFGRLNLGTRFSFVRESGLIASP